MEITSVGPFLLGRTLGTGATGKVKLGFHKSNGFKVAVKIIAKNMLKAQPSTQKKLEREISIMRFLDHSNVLKLFDVYDTPSYLFLVLEHVEGGELFDYLLSKGRLPQEEALRFFQQIMYALDYCLAEEQQILTEEGFMDLCEYERRASENLLVAGYDPASRSIVYERPSRLIVKPRRTQDMVAFGGPNVDLLVTPEHDMYAASSGRSYAKVRADELLSRGAPVQMMRGAPAGSQGVPGALTPADDILRAYGRFLGGCAAREHVLFGSSDCVAPWALRVDARASRLILEGLGGARVRPGARGGLERIRLHAGLGNEVSVTPAQVRAYTGRTWCLTMPHGFLVTRRPGSQAVIVGNCHSHMICHRDLKPENILLDGNMNIKICDYGMAALMRKDALLTTSCGSPHYASPEVIMGGKYNGMEADVWSCGVILFALLVGRLPFDDRNMRKLLLKVKVGVFEMPPWLSKTAKDLIWSLLTVDPAKRITIKQVMKHPWFLMNGPPPQADEHAELDESVAEPLTEDEVDEEVLRTLKTLWGDEENVVEQLLSPEPNMTQVFYRLIEKRLDTDPAPDSVTAIYEQATSSPSTPSGSPPEDEGGRYGFRSRRSSSPAARRSLRASMDSTAGRGVSGATPPKRDNERARMRASEPGLVCDATGQEFTRLPPSGASPKRSWFSFFKKEKKDASPARKGLVKKKSNDESTTTPSPTRRLSRRSIKSPQQAVSSPVLSPNRKKQASMPSVTSPSKKKSDVQPAEHQPLSSHTYMSNASPDDNWSNVERVLDQMGVDRRYSKRAQCLKAMWSDGDPHNTVRFFVRLTDRVDSSGVHHSYAHFELRSGPVTLFDGLYANVASLMEQEEAK